MRARFAIAGALLLGAGPAPVFAAGPFDGTYAGTGELAPGSDHNCPTEYGRRRVTIADGAFKYHHNSAVEVDATVAADGSVSGSAYTQTVRGGSMQTLSGKVSGETLDLTSGNDKCTYHVAMKKTP